MRSDITLYALTVVALLSYLSNYAGADGKHPAVNKGQRIYAANCQSCHREGTNPLNPEKQLAESTKLTTRSIFREFLSSKHGIMPMFQDIAGNDRDLKDLYGYAKSLKNQSWEHPQVEPQPQEPPMKDSAPQNKAE